REAAADLEFEKAARLRDEVKRLQETELAIASDPMARQSEVEDRAGAFAGEQKYGAAANMPKVADASKKGPKIGKPASPRYGAGAFGEDVKGPHKPTLDEMGPHASNSVPAGASDTARPKRAPITRTREFDDPSEKKKRRGRPRKTGRPGA
ncbi:MAG: UvrB/UvrC motif-containing protein, partial [Pseudomonadota bacterium]